MVTHWESSRRPLYVRTVWRDGQRHVVLRKEDEPKSRPADRCQGKPRSASKSSSSRKSSSVTLLLSGVGGLNTPEPKLRRCQTSFHPQAHSRSPDLPATCRDVRQALKVSPRAKVKNLNLSIKSHSIEIHTGRDIEDRTKSVTPFLNRNVCSDSLSERVMIWLDLATQNRETTTQPQCAASPEKPKMTVKDKTFTNYTELDKTNPNSKPIRVDGTSHSLQLLCAQSSKEEEEPVAIVSEKEESEDGQKPRLTSEVEENYEPQEVVEVSPKNRVGTVKRQLHIFMPNLPKKFSDCDSSLLSSKISSCSLHKSIISRKI